jgi:hypothetical protein
MFLGSWEQSVRKDENTAIYQPIVHTMSQKDRSQISGYISYNAEVGKWHGCSHLHSH